LARGKLRCATKKETRLLQILIDTCEAILLKAPEPKNYMVFMPEDGSDHYEGRYQEGLVVLNQSVLRGDFSHALAVFIHECSHRYGCDGNRAFSDQLTEAIERISENRHLLDSYERQWRSLLGQNSRPFIPTRRQAEIAETEVDAIAASTIEGISLELDGGSVVGRAWMRL